MQQGLKEMRWTKLHSKAQERIGEQALEDFIVESITLLGMMDTAKALGVSKATLSYWCKGFEIRVQRVALKPGERLLVVQADEEVRFLGDWRDV